MRTHIRLLTSAAAVAMFAAGAASAQTAAPAAPSITEVVVTAQKREENLQKTPLNVTAVSPDVIDRAGIKDFYNLQKIAPDVTVLNQGGSTNIGIRGIRASATGPTNEGAAAVHLDGVYISRPTGLNGLFFDVQRIEVLKGPQGTLYGRNAAAGVVNVITNKPQLNKFGAGFTAEAGSYDLLRTEAFVNVPIGETFAVRGAFRFYERDGFLDNGLDDAHQESARLSARWTPNEQLDVYASADYQRSDRNGPGTVILEARYRQAAANGALNAPLVLPRSSDPLKDNQYLYPLGVGPGNELQRTWGFSVQADYDFGPVTWTNIVGDRHSFTDLLGLTVGNPANPAALPGISVTPAASNSSSFESRLASNASRPLQWVVGGYAFTERNKGTNCPLPSFTSPFPTTAFRCTGGVEIANPYVRTNSYAFFGQTTYTPDAIDALHLTAGLRYNHDHKAADIYTYFNGAFLNNLKGIEQSWKATTFKLGAAYDITSANMVYANASTGYKSGAFAYGLTPIAKPEYIQAWEAGTKNRFFDGRVQVNFDAYRYNYKNVQTNVTVPSPTPPNPPFLDLSVQSVGRVHYTGASFSTIFAATDNDILELNVEYLKAKYVDYVIPARYSVAPPLDKLGRPTGFPAGVYSGLRVVGSAPWTGRASYTHTFEMGSAGSLDARFDAQYSDTTTLALARPGSIQEVRRGAYIAGDISLRYEPTDGPWNLTAYVNNVSDERIPVSGGWGNNGLVTGQLMPPRTVGMVFSTKY